MKFIVNGGKEDRPVKHWCLFNEVIIRISFRPETVICHRTQVRITFNTLIEDAVISPGGLGEDMSVDKKKF